MADNILYADIMVSDADILWVDVSATIQDFAYATRQAFREADGGLGGWTAVSGGSGQIAHLKAGIGSGLRGSVMQVTVRPSGQDTISHYPIRIRVQCEQAGLFKTIDEITVPAGATAGAGYTAQLQYI